MSIDSSYPFERQETDAIFRKGDEADKFELLQQTRRHAKRVFKLVSGTQSFVPSARAGAKTDRQRDLEENNYQEDEGYKKMIEESEAMAQAAFDQIYKGKASAAFAPTEGSSGAQIRLWLAMLNKKYEFVKRFGLDKRNSAVQTFLPTWPDHVLTPQEYNLAVHTAPYLTNTHDVDVDGILHTLNTSKGNVVILTGSPHNPTGKNVMGHILEIAEVAKRKRHTLALDFSAPGLGRNFYEDVQPSIDLANAGHTHIAFYSLSKIIGGPGKRAGMISIVYGKNDGETIEQDITELYNISRFTGTHPVPDSADLIRRILINGDYWKSFLREQEGLRNQAAETASILQERIPEYRKQFDVEGPYCYLGALAPEIWKGMESDGIFSAPFEDAWGGIGARWNLLHIDHAWINELIEKAHPHLRKNLRLLKRSA